MKVENDDKYFMGRALEEAKKALERGEVPIGAVVVADDRIIARGHNLTQTLNDVTAHAEMQVITAASESVGGKYLKDCTMYVTMEPCQMCAGALYWSQIKRLVFATHDNNRGYNKMKTKLHPKTEVSFGILEDECSEIIKSFFEGKRN